MKIYMKRSIHISFITVSKAIFIIIPFFSIIVKAQTNELNNCNITWNSQSRNSAESMPCGGGDIGLNVWVENEDILFYISRSGTFDENNALLKHGRVRVKLSPNPFAGTYFKQELILKDGYVKINGLNGALNASVNVWVDVFKPVVHVDVTSNKPVKAEAIYESWRYKDRPSLGRANNANSYKWAPPGEVKTHKDSIVFKGYNVLFFHRNKPGVSVFDVTVKQQGMDQVKDQMYNPIKDLTFGGVMEGKNMVPAGITSATYIDTDFKAWKLQSKTGSNSHNINIYLHSQQSPTLSEWETALQQVIKNAKSIYYGLEIHRFKAVTESHLNVL